MVLVGQRGETYPGLLEVEGALLRLGAGEGWRADGLRAARFVCRRALATAVLHHVGRTETGGKRKRRGGGNQDPGLQEVRDRHDRQITDEMVNKLYTFSSARRKFRAVRAICLTARAHSLNAAPGHAVPTPRELSARRDYDE